MSGSECRRPNRLRFPVIEETSPLLPHSRFSATVHRTLITPIKGSLHPSPHLPRTQNSHPSLRIPQPLSSELHFLPGGLIASDKYASVAAVARTLASLWSIYRIVYALLRSDTRLTLSTMFTAATGTSVTRTMCHTCLRRYMALNPTITNSTLPRTATAIRTHYRPSSSSSTTTTTNPPSRPLPSGTWDSHMHVTSADTTRYPLTASATYRPTPHTLSDMRHFHA